jgi:hypothetical protein
LVQVITPWDVQGGADGKVDYNKLIEQVTTQQQQQQQQRCTASAKT